MGRENICSICRHAAGEDAPLLTIGGYGTPRYLCEECSADIDTATLGCDYDAIIAAMDRITEEMNDKGADDPVTLEAVTDILTEAAKRAAAIKDGTYDFNLDLVPDEDLDEELPEELLETEEDRLLDEEENKAATKLDKILNWVWVVLLVGSISFVVWWLFFR